MRARETSAREEVTMIRKRLGVIDCVGLVLTTACVASLAATSPASPPGGQSSTVSASPADPVTFAKDVAPILQRACQNCHRPGAIAPMSLLTDEEARPWARSITQKVASREMPPWYVDRHVGITKFKDDPSLT